MKRKLLIISIFFLSVLGIVSIFSLYANRRLPSINQVDLETVDDLIIGSEFPELLYADENKVIFYSYGIFVFDLKDKRISDSLDVWAFGETLISDGKNYDIRSGQFVSQDGNEIIISYADYSKNFDDFLMQYSYSLSDRVLKEISIEEYQEKRKNIYECKYLKYDDERYQRSTGMIAYINDSEYVYLNLCDFKVSAIKVVHVNGEKENSYDVFGSIVD